MSSFPIKVLPQRWSFADFARVIVIAALVVAAWTVGRGLARLYDEWRMTGRPPASAASTSTELQALAAQLPLAGAWSLDRLDWNVRSHVLKNAEVPARFHVLSATPVDDQVADLPNVSPQIRDYVAELQITPVACAGNQVYAVTLPDFRVALVVRDVAGEWKTIAAAVGFPTSANEWQVIELTPRQLQQDFNKTSAHLLPLPPGSERSGSRWADDGTLLLEFVSVESSDDLLIGQWRSAGWDVRPSGLGVAGSFSYLCARGGDVIYAWSANPPGDLRNLMLVRTPNSADTRPQ